VNIGFIEDTHLHGGTQIWVTEAIRAFQPELIILSAGFDAHQADPLSNMALNTSSFAELTRVVKDIAREVCSNRLISTLEGGYDLDALAESVEAHVKELLND